MFQSINILKSKGLTDEVALHPQTEEDYRKLIKLLHNRKTTYHTFQLPSEKLLHVIIKGIPAPILIEDVKQELLTCGFHPDMVLVTVPKSERQIYQITDILGLIITVEAQRNNAEIGQCHRCQRCGHAQNRCTAPPKYVKCADDHLTQKCEKSRQEPATCANCTENHPAPYPGCSAWLKPLNNKPATTIPGTMYSMAVASEQARNNNKNNLQEPTFSSLYDHFKLMPDAKPSRTA